jgi:hypothetical protein
MAKQKLNNFVVTPTLILCKIWEPYDNSFWEAREREERRRKTPLIEDT